jgi:hypothetical protein
MTFLLWLSASIGGELKASIDTMASILSSYGNLITDVSLKSKLGAMGGPVDRTKA